jgi:uncharacterized cofD-like protein
MYTLRIAGIGGGTGLPVLLRGLAQEKSVDISAIVAVSDNGGSSGSLRSGLGIPAVGDLRNCLVALAEYGSVLADLFQHRFSGGSMDGHALGNLIVAALHQRTGNLQDALEITRRLLMLNGRVLAVTGAPTTLCASFVDGSIVRGESEIPVANKRVKRIWLEPENPAACAGVLEAIYSADGIVLGPGSLYTSVLPNLLVAGVANAIRRSSAVTILVCNLTTQPGETDQFSASDHLRAIEAHLGGGTIDFCVVNAASESPLAKQYLDAGSGLVFPDSQQIRSMGTIPIEGDLLTIDGGKLRHHSDKLAQVVMSIVRAGAHWRAHLDQPRASQGVPPICLNQYAAVS